MLLTTRRITQIIQKFTFYNSFSSSTAHSC